MKRTLMTAIALVTISQGLLMQMIRTAMAEDSQAVETILCTMHNRIERGWNPNKVLNHYNAAPVKHAVDETLGEIVTTGIKSDDTPCTTEYFAVSIEEGKWMFKVEPLFTESGTAFYEREDWGKNQ